MDTHEHYLIADGAGELSSRWVRRACDRTHRIHVDDVARLAPPVGTPRCPDCIVIAARMETGHRCTESCDPGNCEVQHALTFTPGLAQ